MKNLICFFFIIILATNLVNGQNVQILKPNRSSSTADQGSNPFVKEQLLSQDRNNTISSSQFQEEESTLPSLIESFSQVPRDIIDLTGLWMSKTNNCTAAIQWDGQKWLVTVDVKSNHQHLRKGEIIAEFYPSSESTVYGRMKVMKKGEKFKWEEVSYKAKMTELKGKHGWEFYSK